ncbi:MAG: hypothetical protein KBE69_01195, partial [Akkermansia sp.]|nr:hypothetical protein [Akkermansia sp.]
MSPHLPHKSFSPTPEQPEPDTEKTVFPLRAARLILAAVLPLRRPAIQALPGAAHPHVPGRAPVSSCSFRLKGGNVFNLHTPHPDH